MARISPAAYVKRREAYNYTDTDVQFTIVETVSSVDRITERSLPQIDLDKIKADISPLSDQDLRDALLKFRIREKKHQAGNLPSVVVGTFTGIFPSAVPLRHPTGINIRKFEMICAAVFKDCSDADMTDNWADAHLNNLKNVSIAIVHWKMASQGGRGKVRYFDENWGNNTHKQLLDAFRTRSVGKFVGIHGVAIPTATAFLRFLYPNDFGIMDRHVVNEHTQPNGITTLNLRKDGYILNLNSNVKKYETEYIPFLRAEAVAVNSGHATFRDVDASGNSIVCGFRPCDIEMALFSS